MSERPTVHVHSMPGRLRLLVRSLRQKPRKGAGIEDLPELVVPSYTPTVEEVQAYRRLCGFPPSELLPLPYFFVAGFLPQVLLVTDSRFPLKALGMVHLENSFELYEDVRAETPLEIRARALDLDTVEKGRRIRVETRFFHAGRPVARSLSRSFARGGGHGRKKEPAARSDSPTGEEHSRWRLDAAVGRRYAAVSGDYNPIHLYPWSARLLGFRRPIAHGMYLVARAMAELEASLGPDAASPRRLDVRFKTPTFLPGEACLFLENDGDEARFELWSGDRARPHVTGRASTTPPAPVPERSS